MGRVRPYVPNVDLSLHIFHSTSTNYIMTNEREKKKNTVEPRQDDSDWVEDAWDQRGE